MAFKRDFAVQEVSCGITKCPGLPERRPMSGYHQPCAATLVTVIDTRQRLRPDGRRHITDNTRIVIIEADKQVVGIWLIASLRWSIIAPVGD